jgi:hypothetical protein
MIIFLHTINQVPWRIISAMVKYLIKENVEMHVANGFKIRFI